MCSHNWERTNGATTEDGYDTFRRVQCHMTGKSFGLGGIIVPDNDRKPRSRNGITFRHGRGRSLATILRNAQKRGDGLAWSKKQYEKRIKEQ